MRSEGRKVLIGKLGKPHGIKGYIYFHYYGKDLSTLLNYEELIVEQEKSYKLEKTFEKSDRLIIKLEGCDDRNFAEQLRNKKVYVHEENLPALKDGDYYLYQLEGLIVRNLENKILGIVRGSLGTKSNEVLIVQSTHESIDDKERLLPYVKPQVVKEISLEEGLLLVDWPDNF